VAFVVDEDSVGAFGPDAADEPFGVAVGSGCPRWDLDRFDAFGGEHCIEGRAVFGVPVADEEPECRDSVVEVGHEVAGGLCGPRHRGVRGDAEDVDAATGDFHDEQDVEAAQRDGVEVEEVGGQQSGRLGSQEGAPVGVAPGRRRVQACGGQDPADGAGADAVSESGELSVVAAVSPARVLPCQPDDELAELVVDARTTWRVRVGPFLGDQASVPGQQGGGVTRRWRRSSRGRSLAKADRSARSDQAGRAGPSCRRSTVTSCRSVNVSAISALLRQQSSASQDSIRVKVR
jgi:hypothetical protein